MQVLVLNGTLCDSSLWTVISQRIEKKFNGRVRYAELINGRSIEAYAHDIGGSLKAGKTWLLGYSLGGIVGLELAKQYPDFISGMILVCTNHLGQTEQKQEAMQKQLDLLDSEGMNAVFDKILLPAYFGLNLDDHQKEAEILKKMGRKMGPDIYRNQLKTLETRIDQTSFLSHISIPTLIVCAKDDKLCPLSLQKELHRGIANSRLCIVENAGHMLPLTRSDFLAGEIEYFIKNA